MTTPANDRQKIGSLTFSWLSSLWRCDVFVLMTGAFWLFLGSAEILGCVTRTSFANMQDPIFDISFHQIVLILGLAQVGVASVCLFTRNRVLSLGLVAWLSANFIVYRMGLWSMGWHRSGSLMMESVGISLARIDLILSLAFAGLLSVSLASLWIEYRAQKSAENVKMCCPACGVHIRFAVENLGQTVPCPQCRKTVVLRKPGNLKMSCFFCKEHIEFPSHAVGEKMPCPHCKMDITLKGPM